MESSTVASSQQAVGRPDLVDAVLSIRWTRLYRRANRIGVSGVRPSNITKAKPLRLYESASEWLSILRSEATRHRVPPGADAVEGLPHRSRRWLHAMAGAWRRIA